MTSMKSGFIKHALIAAVAGGALFATAASAETVCNRWNECWHVKSHVADYPKTARMVIRNEAWEAKHRTAKAYHWRADRDEHGYYRHGKWVAY